MKKFRQFFVAFLLTLTLTLSALAGEMPTMGIAAPPSPSAGGEMPATEVMLTVIEGILSIL